MHIVAGRGPGYNMHFFRGLPYQHFNVISLLKRNEKRPQEICGLKYCQPKSASHELGIRPRPQRLPLRWP